MKVILHVIQGGRGGNLEYLKLIIPRFSGLGYKSIVICHGQIYNELEKLGYYVFKVEMNRSISPINDLKALIKIFSFMRKNNIDIVYTHSEKAGVLGRIAAKINRLPCIYNPHGWSFNMAVNKVKKHIYKIIERTCALFTTKIIVISNSEYKDAINNKICSQKKLKLINNGINLHEHRNINNKNQLLKKLNISLEVKIIGLVSRLTDVKAPITFVYVADEILKKRKDCFFIVVGDGEKKDEMIDLCNKPSINKYFKFTGWSENPKKFISLFDVGVLTSKKEGFGLVLLEYMVCGKPIVASNVGGIPYVVRNNIDGFLCEADDIEMFSKKIQSLLNDEVLYGNIKKNVLRRVKIFDISISVKEHVKLLKALLNIKIVDRIFICCIQFMKLELQSL